jgi:esterase/lipase superfamily enzyme
MMQGTYYKEWSRMLGREMEFKVYGTAGVPVLALPARGGRFYDWENNGMPEAVASC